MIVTADKRASLAAEKSLIMGGNALMQLFLLKMSYL